MAAESHNPNECGQTEIIAAEDYAALMRTWEAHINTLPLDEDLNAALQQATAEINEVYPYNGETVHFSGEGIFPASDDMAEETSGEFVQYDTATLQNPTDCWGATEGLTGVANGIWPISCQEVDRTEWRLMHRVSLGTATKQTSLTLVQQNHLFCYLTAAATLVPVKGIEEIYNEADAAADTLPHPHNTLSTLSDQLSGTISSTRFRRLKHAAQKRIVDACVERAEREAGIREKWAVIDASYCYAPLLKGDELHQILLDISDTLVSGHCLGVESAERVRLQYKAIRSDAHVTDKYAGLCIVVEPEESVAQELGVNTGQILFVPISSQEIEVIFEEES